MVGGVFVFSVVQYVEGWIVVVAIDVDLGVVRIAVGPCLCPDGELLLLVDCLLGLG